MLIFERPILMLMGATASTYAYAAQFYRIFNVGAVLVTMSIIPGNLMRTEGRARETMVATVLGIVINVIFDPPLFILGFHMGAAGAALANLLGYLLSDALLVVYIIKRCRVITVDWRKMSLQRDSVWQVLIIGIPASVTNLMISYQTALFNNYLARYGADQVAALGIATKVSQVVNAIMVGFAFGAQPLVGYNYGGAKNHKRLQAIIRFDIIVEVLWSLVMASLMILVAPWIVSLFLKNPNVIHYGTQLLRILLVTTPFAGAILVYTTVFQSTAQAFNALVMSVSRQGVFFTIAIVIGNLLFGYNGIIWSQAVADVLTAALGWYLYRRQVRKVNQAL